MTLLTPAEIATATASHKSFDNGVQIGWDATSLDAFQTCPRKYYYSVVLGLTPKNKSVHLVFGGIYASALENFYKYRAEGDEIETALRKIIREAMTGSWDSERGTARTFDHPSKTRVGLIRSLVWYVEEFGDESESAVKTHHLSDGKPAVELSFTFDLSPSIVYAGHLDRVVTMSDDLYVMDQKTTATTISPYYFGYFKPNNQMSGYAFAGKLIFKSPVRGVIIDAAQILVNSTRFERGITPRTAEELDEWAENTIEVITGAQSFSERGLFPMNPNSCSNYGGCPFRSICTASPKIRENYIKSDYTSRVWDPLTPR